MNCLKVEYESEFEIRHWSDKSISIRYTRVPYGIVVMTPYSTALNRWCVKPNFRVNSLYRDTFNTTMEAGRKRAKELLYELYLETKREVEN